MSIPPESIEVGKCYLAEGGRDVRIRRVVHILPDERVQYEQRTPKSHWIPGIQERRSFAAMLLREVPCDWAPGTDEPKL
jgi:hypothetical protein